MMMNELETGRSMIRGLCNESAWQDIVERHGLGSYQEAVYVFSRLAGSGVLSVDEARGMLDDYEQYYLCA